MAIKDSFLQTYQKHETKIDVLVFLGGFLFDVLFLSAIDDLLGLGQNIVYLIALGSLLYFDFLYSLGELKIPKWLERPWEYRQLGIHFFLGSLLSVYSLFFLKSASLFSSIIFVAILMILMVANETPFLKKQQLNIKMALYVLLVFSFFSMMIPTFIGFVGFFPFILATLATCGVLFGIYKLLLLKAKNDDKVKKALLYPGGAVIILFLSFYVLGWIPPVPISIETIGVYHKIEKIDNQYMAYYEKPAWNIFEYGEKEFLAEPTDEIHLFVQIFSPAKFSDEVILHWLYKDSKAGWISADKIRMKIYGGRQQGYRGQFVKKNYSAGDWRVSVETTDGREIGRYYFNVEKTLEVNPTREFRLDIF